MQTLVTILFNVKVWDATAADPKLLVFLKYFPNTLPVRRHCCQKTKFWLVSQQFMVYRLKMHTHDGCGGHLGYWDRVRKINR